MLHIVVVDDEERIRRGIEKIIQKSERNHEDIHCFSNGQEALDYILQTKQGEVDVLITDIKMPVMDGLKLIEHVSKTRSEIHQAILSGFNDFEYARQALRFGVKEFFLKPIDKIELIRMLDRIDETLHPAGVDGREQLQSGSGRRVIEEIKRFIEKEYVKGFNLTELAEKVYLNPTYVSNLFKSATGERLTDYLIKVRIEKAKQFLELYPELKVFEVGDKVGYPEPVYFNKLFKKVVGMTPKEYKEQAR